MVQSPSCKCLHVVNLSVAERVELSDVNILICWIFYENFFEKGKNIHMPGNLKEVTFGEGLREQNTVYGGGCRGEAPGRYMPNRILPHISLIYSYV